MPYNVNRDSGFAERQSWIQVGDSVVPPLTGDEGVTNNNKDKRFASLVYSVNPSQINISGGVSIDKVGLKTSDEVTATSGQLFVHDQDVVDAINNISLSEDNYSSVIQERSTDTYIAEAPIGTTYATSGWRVQKIDSSGTTTWSDSANFSLPANGELSGLTPFNP